MSEAKFGLCTRAPVQLEYAATTRTVAGFAPP